MTESTKHEGETIASLAPRAPTNQVGRRQWRILRSGPFRVAHALL